MTGVGGVVGAVAGRSIRWTCRRFCGRSASSSATLSFPKILAYPHRVGKVAEHVGCRTRDRCSRNSVRRDSAA